MVGFKTKTGSTYYVDLENKQIWGGCLEEKISFTGTPRIMIGDRAEFSTPKGVLSTSPVESYF